MKRLITLILAGVMVFSLAACGDKTEPEVSIDETPVVESTPAPTPDKEPVQTEDTVANVLLKDFEEKAKSTVVALDIAKELVSNDIISFNGDAINVEPGLLTGFGETEIKGFSDGAMFLPMIGTIPFVGYVFVLEEDTDVEEFKKNLMEAADLRWNICTEADEKVISSVDNKVFFVMSPLSFEEEPMMEEMSLGEPVETEETVTE